MQELSHDHIDLLKVDIEGAEYELIDDILDSSVAIRQLLVEFHHRLSNIGFVRTETTVDKLTRAGFHLFDVSPSGEEYAFLFESPRDG